MKSNNSEENSQSSLISGFNDSPVPASRNMATTFPDSWCSSRNKKIRRRSLLCATYVYELVLEREWKILIRLMHDRDFYNVLDMSCISGEAGLNLLHVICRFQPPEELVETMLYQFPSLSYEKDAQGRFPLHYASLHGSRSAVVKSLLAYNPEAAMQADISGKLPLHLACRPVRWQAPDEIDEENLYMQPGSAVIVALCKAAPDSTNVEDSGGCNALELAIEFNLSCKICQVLMETSIEAWKAKEKPIDDDKKMTLPKGNQTIDNESACLCYEDEMTRIYNSTQTILLRQFPPYEEMLNFWKQKQKSVTRIARSKKKKSLECNHNITGAKKCGEERKSHTVSTKDRITDPNSPTVSSKGQLNERNSAMIRPSAA